MHLYVGVCIVLLGTISVILADKHLKTERDLKHSGLYSTDISSEEAGSQSVESSDAKAAHRWAMESAQSSSEEEINITKRIKEHSSSKRTKRSFFRLLAAVLDSATRTYTSAGLRMYKKSGGLSRADKDFDALNPSNVRLYQNAKIGFIGSKITVSVGRDLDVPRLTIVNTMKTADGETHRIINTIEYTN